ncbi:hypothetical protein [Dongshaea marina]|uniref:hypothetical protein n=1 Tax=Dongshaea marina TaxID=2047966 RepID=UPI000D3E57B1|nr:hypothetical protein [Dongshaea marina]
MSQNQPLTDEQKLTVTHYVEPGCLGPDGKDHIEAFCQHAQKVIEAIDPEFVNWVIKPRYDKSVDDTQYHFANKRLTEAQAAKYLARFGQDIDEFEEQFNDQIMHEIEEFLGRG